MGFRVQGFGLRLEDFGPSDSGLGSGVESLKLFRTYPLPSILGKSFTQQRSFGAEGCEESKLYSALAPAQESSADFWTLQAKFNMSAPCCESKETKQGFRKSNMMFATVTISTVLVPNSAECAMLGLP